MREQEEDGERSFMLEEWAVGGDTAGSDTQLEGLLQEPLTGEENVPVPCMVVRLLCFPNF